MPAAIASRILGARSSILLAVAAIAVFAGDAAAQCRIEGVLRGTDGAPVAGATVRVQGPELRPALTTTTGADGRYSVENIKPGQRVEITAYQDGRAVSRAFTLVTLFVETVDLAVQPEVVSTVGVELDPGGGPSGGIRGFVRAGGGGPLESARVTISGTAAVATTDAAGRYEFLGLRSGVPLEVKAAASGFRETASTAVVPTGGNVETDFALETLPVAPTRSFDQPPLAVADNEESSLLRPDTAAGLPALTHDDLFRAVEWMPSALANLEASSELYVRGGTPDQTQLTMDGFTIYPIPHPFGRFSALNMDAVDRADFSETAVNPAAGGHLAGALQLTGASNTSGRPDGVVDLSILGWGARFSAPLGDRATLLVAARATPPTTLYDRVLDQMAGNPGNTVRDRVASFSGGPFSFSPSSSFHDVNGKLSVRLSPNDRVSATFYDARDAANQSRNDPQSPASTAIAEPGPFLPLPADAVAQVSDVETWKGLGLSAQWQRQWSGVATTTLSVGHSEFSNDDAVASVLTSPSTGVDYSFAAGRGGSDGLVESNLIRDTTIRLDDSISLGFQHFLSVGGEIVSLDATYDAQTEVAQRSSRSSLFTTRLADLLNQAATARATTAYAQDSWRPFAGLAITPGARLTHYDLAGSGFFDPRVSASYQVGRWVRLLGAWTIDHQVANRITREDLVRGDGYFWTLANGSTIPVPRARQVVVGTEVEMPALVFDVRAYYKNLDDLTIFAPRLFPGAGLTVGGGNALYYGSGIAKGIELLLQHRAPLNTVWTSYTLSRADDTFVLLEPKSFPASYDATHAFKVVDSVRIGRSWSMGGAFVASSGRPTTPLLGVTQVWFPSGLSVYQPTFGPKNSSRLPSYNRLDLSLQRTIPLRWIEATLIGSIFNVYDRQNISELEYSTLQAQPVTYDALLLRRTFDVRLRVAF